MNGEMKNGKERVKKELPPDVAGWLKSAVDDAERRGLPELKPMLESLAQAMAVLRAADWNEDAAGRAPRSDVGSGL